MYNPVKYTDPSGNSSCDTELDPESCSVEDIIKKGHTPSLSDFGVTTSGWSSADEQAILNEVIILAQALLSACTSEACRNLNMYSIFKRIFGPINFQRVNTYTYKDGNGKEITIDPDDSWICYSSLLCIGKNAYGVLGNPSQEGLMIHELGHQILNKLGLHDESKLVSLGYYENGVYIHVTGINQMGQYERTNNGYAGSFQPYQQHDSSFDDWISSPLEDHADMIMNWALVGFDDNIAGDLRMDYMNSFMEAAVNSYFGGQ
jgi:hypothetical protein